MNLRERIEAAIARIASGAGAMRIPAEPTDPDIVLRDCAAEIERLTAQAENDADHARSLMAERDALKARVAELEAALHIERGMARAQMSAILYTIGGEVEGAPTLAINYLQRLRELVQCEKALHRARESEAALLAAVKDVRHHFVCCCGEAYRSRNLHAPECKDYELDDIDAAIAKAEGQTP